ncbi:MAG TPA: excinuclease ABC subunit UvrC [Nitrospirales bacterium]|nr:excinuclease ABC subunit UvrC [Nitrospirales bacterium]
MISATSLPHLPDNPGVYLMKDSKGVIIYIGKARSLSSRVRSYFLRGAVHSSKTSRMVEEIADIDWIVTASDLEALLLESNLVKHHQPKFNIVLRDDKQYPYLRLPVKDDFPRLTVVRKVEQDGALYFGPYVPAGALRGTLRVIRKVFPLATCELDLSQRAERACLEFEIKRCMAPCIGNQTSAEYGEIVTQVRMFLEGRDRELGEALKAEMIAAADRCDFEEAARKRNQLFKVERVLEKQRITQVGMVDQDVIGMARDGGLLAVHVLFVRGGLLIGRKEFFWNNVRQQSDHECLRSIIEQFYAMDLVPPKEVLLPFHLEEQAAIISWLSLRKGEAVRVTVPRRGGKVQLLELARENAAVRLQEHVRRKASNADVLTAVLTELGLDTLPTRMVGVDISNIQGAQAVGSLVVFENGISKNSEYRRFKIKTVDGPDDFAMIGEVMQRFGARICNGEVPRPDLILVDGGRGQLSSAQASLAKLGLDEIEIIGLAKAHGEKFERVFIGETSEAIPLDPHSQATHLLQRVRDEAHRFALTYHRKLRGNEMLGSRLDEIVGIGKARKQALLKQIGSIDRIRQATAEELQRVPGITIKMARVIQSALGRD